MLVLAEIDVGVVECEISGNRALTRILKSAKSAQYGTASRVTFVSLIQLQTNNCIGPKIVQGHLVFKQQLEATGSVIPTNLNFSVA